LTKLLTRSRIRTDVREVKRPDYLTLEQLPNLGPVSARRLRAVGVQSAEDLRRLGPVEAYVRLKQMFSAEVSTLTLYALHGAVAGVRWYELPEATRAALRDAASRRL
jgi:DNA transformation protein